ncbi:hypothetical protein ABT364_21675 [Massilia sp. SR12]
MKHRLIRFGMWALIVLVLALAFAAYLRPAFMLDLANRVYLCF